MITLVRAERRMIWEKAKPPRELEGTHFKYLQMQVPLVVTVKVSGKDSIEPRLRTVLGITRY